MLPSLLHSSLLCVLLFSMGQSSGGAADGQSKGKASYLTLFIWEECGVVESSAAAAGPYAQRL